MQKHIASLAILCFFGSVTLATHAKETDANEKNFAAAMTRFFDKQGNLCLRLRAWPIILRPDILHGFTEETEMAALEAIGLVEGKDTEVDGTAPIGMKKQYTLTSLGKFVEETSWPLDVSENELTQNTNKIKSITALEAVKMIKGTSTETAIGNTKIKVKRFVLTDAGSRVKKTTWPQTVSENELKQNTDRAREMAALQTAGLLESLIFDIEGKIKIKAKSYTLTKAAQPFVPSKHEVESDGERKTKADLCWGKMALDKIVKWEGPWKLGNLQEVSVTYTSKINNIADWAKKPEIQATFFSDLKYVLENVDREAVRKLRLTSKGWEVVDD